MKKVLLINQFNSDNLGDNLLSNMLSRYLEKKNIEVNNIGYALDKEQRVNYNVTTVTSYQKFKRKAPNFLKYHFLFKRNLKRTLSRINLADYSGIIIGGGQLIKHKTVFSYCFNFWSSIARKNNIPLFIYGVGVDSNLSQSEINRYSKGIKYARFINCRDLESQQAFEELFNVKAVVSPDVAFSLIVPNKRKENIMVVMPYNYEVARHSFGYEITEDNYYTDLYDKVKQFYNNDYKIVLSATTTSDARECLNFKKYLETKEISVELCEAQKIDDLINLFSRSKVILTGRMHAMIMGLCSDNKIIPIVISHKIRTFEKEYLNDNYNYEQIKEYSDLGIEQLISKL